MNDDIRRRISARLAVKPHNAADLCQFYNHYKEDIPVLIEDNRDLRLLTNPDPVVLGYIAKLEAIAETARAVVKKWNAPPDDGFYLFSLIRELQRALAAYDKATKEVE